jgi:hypothetical protein
MVGYLSCRVMGKPALLPVVIALPRGVKGDCASFKGGTSDAIDRAHVSPQPALILRHPPRSTQGSVSPG